MTADGPTSYQSEFNRSSFMGCLQFAAVPAVAMFIG